MTTVAETIRDQIGFRALRMMGAKDFTGDQNSLTFRIGRNAKSVTHVRVVLTPDDLYEVVFYRVRGTSIKEVSKEEMVYSDSLLPTLTSHTGLYTTL